MKKETAIFRDTYPVTTTTNAMADKEKRDKESYIESKYESG